MIFILENEDIYWIWLAQSLGPGNKKIKTILNFYNTAKNFYEKGLQEWRLCGCFTPREIKAFQENSLEDANDVILKCNLLDIDIITIANEKFPNRLKNIINPPCVLYIKGNFPDFDQNICISIVGTRNATSYGLEMAFKLSFDLASKGVIIVSGGALGIDSAAHKGTLQALGKTALVMGCGLNHRYLMENTKMRNEIVKNGVLISEYPPDTTSIPRNFPMRNRIISGLSQGVLVIEAGKKSGSLITANLALEQNKDLFAVPGNINSKVSNGTNDLIKECAKPVTCIEDILEEYPHIEILKNKTNIAHVEIKKKTKKLPDSLSKNALNLYSKLKDNPIHIDDLSRKSKISVNELLGIITELEIYDLIKTHAGRKYSKLER